MSFQSFSFLAFLAVTVIVCLTAERKNRFAGLLLLAVACALFCLLGNQGFITLWVLLIGCQVTDRAERYFGTPETRKRALTLACTYHVLVLAIFKYTGFLSGGAVRIPWVPIGLSFFTFQQIWHMKEVYTGEYVPDKDDSLPLYALFFPTLTSGPILRPSAFYPQLQSDGFLRPGAQDVAAGLYAICIGMAKKVLLADPFGVIVNNGWGALEKLDMAGAWLLILGYTFQLYFDFSGYCDMATGCARLLGIRLPVNFNSPYRSLSVGEFWKRWHITLTTFLRECLYFPLGGSRKGSGRTYLHILIIFLASGIWHGAGWTFIVWGVLHGLGQIVERVWGKGRDRLPRLIRWGLTFLFVNLAWVFFRAPDIAGALELLQIAFTPSSMRPHAWLLNGLYSKETGAIQLLWPEMKPLMNGLRVAGLYGIGTLAVLWPRNTMERMESFKPTLWRAAILTVLTVWSILSFSGVTTFIYSNF